MKKVSGILVLLALSGAASAQVSAEGVSVKKVKREVEVRFEVREEPEGLRSREKMVLRPYLYEGADTLWLEEGAVYGQIRYKRERQEAALAGERDWALGEREALRGRDTLVYAVRERYERWMRRASLGVAYHREGCGCECCWGHQALAEDAEVYVAPVPAVADEVAQPKRFEVVEAKRRWDFGEEMKVYFRVGKTDLRLDVAGNRETLEEIVAGIRKIGDMERLRLQGVEITGFASPEGGLALNTRLGAGRAQALKAYIRGEVPELEDGDFRLVNGVENWDGLRRLVEGSEMEYRSEVLAILDKGDMDGKRKAELRALAGGKPYRYMLREFYPALRNACYVSVYYDVLGDRGADAVNAANGLIREGKYGEALELLLEFREDDRAFNSIGVCYMMLEDEEEAIGWFERALEAGHEAARGNLEQLK